MVTKKFVTALAKLETMMSTETTIAVMLSLAIMAAMVVAALLSDRD